MHLPDRPRHRRTTLVVTFHQDASPYRYLVIPTSLIIEVEGTLFGVLHRDEDHLLLVPCLRASTPAPISGSSDIVMITWSDVHTIHIPWPTTGKTTIAWPFGSRTLRTRLVSIHLQSKPYCHVGSGLPAPPVCHAVLSAPGFARPKTGALSSAGIAAAWRVSAGVSHGRSRQTCREPSGS
jgi:hypothetical protein